MLEQGIEYPSKVISPKNSHPYLKKKESPKYSN